MGSPAWYHRRRDWIAAWTAVHGRPPVCAVCDQPWTLESGDLHHRSYFRLGHEIDSDLLPVCNPCHLQVHALLERWPGWRRLSRAQATDLIVAQLRHQHRAAHA
jgi:hypothetical protein